MIFEAKDISKKYGTTTVLDSIDLEVDKGQIISIYGSSGSGKTTLLNILGLLDSPSQGRVCYSNNIDYDNFRSRDRVATIGHIFQFHHLLAEFKIIENLIIPQLMKGGGYSDSFRHAKELLDFVGLSELSDSYPSQVSGGERQRVAVLRGIVNKPKVVFADEPTGNLDNDNSLFIIKLLNDLKDDFDISFVIATHDREVTKISQKSFYIIDGKLKNETL